MQAQNVPSSGQQTVSTGVLRGRRGRVALLEVLSTAVRRSLRGRFVRRRERSTAAAEAEETTMHSPCL